MPSASCAAYMNERSPGASGASFIRARPLGADSSTGRDGEGDLLAAVRRLDVEQQGAAPGLLYLGIEFGKVVHGLAAHFGDDHARGQTPVRGRGAGIH